MSRRRDSIADLTAMAASRRRLERSAAAPPNLESYIRSTERIIGSLKRDLDAYRNQNDALTRERASHARELARVELAQRDHRGLDGEIRFLRAERDRLAHQNAELKDERDRAVERNARLESSVARLTVQYEEALEVISYLEAQIDSIESIVALLKEHKRFMEGDE